MISIPKKSLIIGLCVRIPSTAVVKRIAFHRKMGSGLEKKEKFGASIILLNLKKKKKTKQKQMG